MKRLCASLFWATFVFFGMYTSWAQGADPRCQKIEVEIENLRQRQMSLKPGTPEYYKLGDVIRGKLKEKNRVCRQPAGEMNPDLNGNRCVDAGEANQYELITGKRYTGPLPFCGPDMPVWR